MKIQEDAKNYQYIFKIELYGEDRRLKEVLYDDMERYNHDVKGIEENERKLLCCVINKVFIRNKIVINGRLCRKSGRLCMPT